MQRDNSSKCLESGQSGMWNTKQYSSIGMELRTGVTDMLVLLNTI